MQHLWIDIFEGLEKSMLRATLQGCFCDMNRNGVWVTFFVVETWLAHGPFQHKFLSSGHNHIAVELII